MFTWWFPWKMSPEAAGKPRAAWPPGAASLSCHRSMVAIVTARTILQEKLGEAKKRKKGEIIWGCLAAPAGCREDICRSVGIQSDSCNQRRLGKSGRGQQLRLPECPCASTGLPVTLCFLKWWPSSLDFRAVPGTKIYLAWKLRARTRKLFALTEIT